MWHYCVLVLASLVAVHLQGCAANKSYKGYHVRRVTLNGTADLEAMKGLLEDASLQLELWSEPRSVHGNMDIQVMGPMFPHLASALGKLHIKHANLIEDIQSVIETQAQNAIIQKTRVSRERRSTDNDIPNEVIGKYALFHETEQWMQTLAKNWPKVVTLHSVGLTHENRKIYVLQIGKAVPGRIKPGIYMDGGLHAREWISPATVNFLIYELLSQYIQGNKEAVRFLEEVDWYFVPHANPDGYAYTHENDRLWRKNRSPNENSTCIGTDLNRNWPFHWGTTLRTSSSDPCDLMHMGSMAGSELETQALMAFILARNDSIGAYVSFHSYTQQWFTRWGYSSAVAPDHEQMLNLAQRAVAALTNESGVRYSVGRPFELLYAYSGGSADWVKGVVEIKYSYTVELRDKGNYGFLLPPISIRPVGKEIFAAIKVIANQLLDEAGIPAPNSTTTSTNSTTMNNTISTNSATIGLTTRPSIITGQHTSGPTTVNTKPLTNSGTIIMRSTDGITTPCVTSGRSTVRNFAIGAAGRGPFADVLLVCLGSIAALSLVHLNF